MCDRTATVDDRIIAAPIAALWVDDGRSADPASLLNAAYAEFENRTSLFGGRGSKQRLIKRFVANSLSNEFTIEDVRRAAPGVSDSTIEKVFDQLKKDGVIERRGAGRGSKWHRLRADFLDDPPPETAP